MSETVDRWADRREWLPTPQDLSDLIGTIYDCALDPSKWESVLAVICRRFAFSSSMMGVARFPDAPFVLASTGVEPDLLARLPDLSADMAALWGGWAQIQQFPLDEPIVHSQVLSAELLKDNAYGAYWVSRGVEDAAICTISRDAGMFGNVGFNRHRSAGAIGDVELDGLRWLTPHLRRSVTISNLFDLQRIEAATFSKVLDGFRFGVVLVDASLHIVHANTVAAGLLAARDPLRSHRGAIVLTNPAAHAALERAVRHAAGEGTALGSRGIGIPARQQDGDSKVVHVLPLKQGSLRSIGQRAEVALFIAPAFAVPGLPSDALALLYDLTPAEIRVLELIVAGQTSATVVNMAKILGISASTVKTHLVHLYQKTGCQRQSEIVKLASNLSIPI